MFINDLELWNKCLQIIIVRNLDGLSNDEKTGVIALFKIIWDVIL